MRFKSLIKNNVNKAIRLLGDLAVDVQLTNKTATDFDFGTDTPNYSSDSTITVKGVLLNKSVSKDPLSNAIKAELLMKASDVDSPDLYDVVLIEGVTWNVIPPYTNDGYTIKMNISRSS